MKAVIPGVNGCEYCGCEEFYVKATISGRTEVNFRFDGEEADNGDLFTNATVRKGTTAFCIDCHAIVGSAIHAD